MSTAEKYRQLKVSDLKDLLLKRGLPVSGKKEELVARLLAAEDRKQVETINQPSKNSSTTRKSSLENIINKDTAEPSINSEVKEDSDLFDKDLITAADIITTGIDNDFDWEIPLPKDGEFDPLISPVSPSLSVTSIKDEKARTELVEATKGSVDVTNIAAKHLVETTKKPSSIEAKTLNTESSSSNSDSIVKPSGFTCKKIVFDNVSATTASQTPNKSQTDLTTELERRKKRAERFGVGLSDADKKLQRAARFGTTVSNPLDVPLTAPRMPNRKPSIVEDEERLKKRAERFGLDKANNTSNEEEKKRKRAERFGSNAPSNSAITSPSSKTSSNPVSEINEEEKKKRRAERFAIDTNGEPTSKKVKT